MNILLLGYYGYKNIGDDLFVKNLIQSLSCQNRQISLICEEDYYKSAYLNNPNIEFYRSQKISKLQRLSLILKSDYIAWGGGSLEINKKPVNLLLIQRLAKVLRKRFGFLGVGLEGLSLKSQVIDPSVKRLFDTSNFLYLRDYESYQFAKDHLPAPKISCLGGDLAFLNLEFYKMFQHPVKPSSLQNLSFSGKHWWGEGRAKFYAQPLKGLIEKYGTHVHLLPANVGFQANDNQFHERLRSFLPEKNYTLHHWDQAESFLEVLGGMDFHIGNRLHSIILADILGVPNIGINSGDTPKIKRYIQKTATLAKERTADFMEEITLERIDYIFQTYCRPTTFIEQESQTAQECLAQIFCT